jgi:hypothetical protein
LALTQLVEHEKARADKEKTQREATAWLDKIHAGGVKFASDVAKATPHQNQTPRNSSSQVSTGSLPPPGDAVLLAENITTALQSDSSAIFTV